MKPFRRAIVRIAVVALLGALTVGCASIRESIETPTVSLVGVQLLEAGLLQQRYGVTLRVDNPNAIGLPIKGLRYDIKLAGIDFASGQSPRAFKVGARGNSNVDLEVTTNLLDTVRRLRDWMAGSPDAMDYEISGDVDVDLPFVGTVPFSETGQVDLRSAR